jgi:hypothetical protein
MKLVSFDVGIKNMAYCVLIIEQNTFYVQDWGIINLMYEKEEETQQCNFLIKGKQPKICNKKAKYYKNNHFLCETHAKMACKQFSWTLPNKIFRKNILNQKTKQELFTLGKDFQFLQEPLKTKKECIDLILQQVQEKCLEPIVKKKKKTAGDIDLISIGRALKEELNKMSWVQEISHVIIENQISTIATRMKTLQGMLTQYFIMQDRNINIEYISSSNKLKNLISNEVQENNYQQHKKDSVFIAQKFVQENESLQSWNSAFDIRKKDDLADAFLQGIWYMKHKNIISYAENLKINCVTLS